MKILNILEHILLENEKIKDKLPTQSCINI